MTKKFEMEEEQEQISFVQPKKTVGKLISVDELSKIRAEIAAIDIDGQVDEHTMFIRTGEQVKQMALNIIDKYRDKEV